jgi:hypothetical protein
MAFIQMNVIKAARRGNLRRAFFSFSTPSGEKAGMRGPIARSVSDILFEKRYKRQIHAWREPCRSSIPVWRAVFSFSPSKRGEGWDEGFN